MWLLQFSLKVDRARIYFISLERFCHNQHCVKIMRLLKVTFQNWPDKKTNFCVIEINNAWLDLTWLDLTSSAWRGLLTPTVPALQKISVAFLPPVQCNTVSLCSFVHIYWTSVFCAKSNLSYHRQHGKWPTSIFQNFHFLWFYNKHDPTDPLVKSVFA